MKEHYIIIAFLWKQNTLAQKCTNNDLYVNKLSPSEHK